MSKARDGKPGHTPGRGHRRKSDPQKTKRFQQKAAKKKANAEELYRHAIRRWEAMTEDQQRLLPELHPDNFKS
jgi:hypothetical protein